MRSFAQPLSTLSLLLVVVGCATPMPDDDGWDAWAVSSDWDEASDAREVGDFMCETDDPAKYLDEMLRIVFDRFSEQFGALDEIGNTNYSKFSCVHGRGVWGAEIPLIR